MQRIKFVNAKNQLESGKCFIDYLFIIQLKLWNNIVWLKWQRFWTQELFWHSIITPFLLIIASFCFTLTFSWVLTIRITIMELFLQGYDEN